MEESPERKEDTPMEEEEAQEEPENLSKGIKPEVDQEKEAAKEDSPPRNLIEALQHPLHHIPPRRPLFPFPPMPNNLFRPAMIPRLPMPMESNLLPNMFPMQMDNSNEEWENFIEIDKEGETSKLEHLVNSLGHKLPETVHINFQ